MKSFQQILEEVSSALDDAYTEALNEELHPELKDILHDEVNNKWNQKLTRISKKMRELTGRGENTGISGDKPKKGSSRAVFFPTSPKKLKIDGRDTDAHTAVKIAFKGQLDNHTEEKRTLGEHQNEIEADHFIRQHHSILSHNQHTGEYETNPNGVTVPVFDNHEDHHWLETGVARDMTKKDFKEATKLPSHPKGLDFDKFHNKLVNDHNIAHGGRGIHHLTPEEEQHIESHPMYENVTDFIHNSDNHPGDLRKQNWGMWKHPITGKEHPVIRDYGYSNTISKLYTKARRNMANIIKIKIAGNGKIKR
jgi:hypothetical protein